MALEAAVALEAEGGEAGEGGRGRHGGIARLVPWVTYWRGRQGGRPARPEAPGFVNSTWPHRDRLIWPHQWDTFAKSLVPDGHFGWSPRKLNSQ